VAFGALIAVDEDGMVVSCCLTVAIAEMSRRKKARMGMTMKVEERDEAEEVCGFRA